MGNFSLELEIEVIDSLTTVLYFYLLSFFIFCDFVDILNMNLWMLMIEKLGEASIGLIIR